MFPIRSPRRRPVARLIVAVFCIVAAAKPADAIDMPAAPAALREAVQSAWRSHPDYRVTEARLAAARARLDAAGKPLYNPELELIVNDEGPDRTATAGLSLTLDLSGKRRTRQDAAEARVGQTTAEARLQRRNFARQWFSGWADLLAARQRIGLGERRLALVTRFSDLADKQFSADDISGLERDLAALAREEAQAQQSQLEAEYADADARFREVGGSAEDTLENDLPTDTLPAPLSLPAPREAQPDWQVAKAAAVASAREVLVARRNRVADPRIGISGGRIDYGSFRDNVVGFSLSLPLFVRNSYGAEVIAAQAEADAADAEVARVSLQIDTELHRAVANYASSHAAWSRWKGSRGTDVERRARLLERLWQQGELSTADYLLQLKQTLDTALAGAELEARVWRNFIEYLAATGQLERWAGLEGTL